MTDSSAAPIIDGTERCGIAADHRNMCRFENARSWGYRVIAAALMRWSAESQDVVASRWMDMDNQFRQMRAREAAELLQTFAGPQESHLALMTRQGRLG